MIKPAELVLRHGPMPSGDAFWLLAAPRMNNGLMIIGTAKDEGEALKLAGFYLASFPKGAVAICNHAAFAHNAATVAALAEPQVTIQ